jgi:hypothetical protein
LGFAVHTGWAAMVAVSSGSTSSVEVLDRRRLEMIAGRDPEIPRFAYHAAKDLPLDAAERLIRGIAEQSLATAKTALKAAVDELETRNYRIVASGIIVGGRPLPASLASILQTPRPDSHRRGRAVPGSPSRRERVTGNPSHRRPGQRAPLARGRGAQDLDRSSGTTPGGDREGRG